MQHSHAGSQAIFEACFAAPVRRVPAALKAQYSLVERLKVTVTTGQAVYQSHHYHRVPGYHFGGSARTTPPTTLRGACRLPG